MDAEELRRRIRRLEDIASPSPSLDRILDLAADCESDIQELTGAIETDPGITSRVLKLSNSAYFGVAGGVATVNRAILVIGYKNVLSLATCAALAPVFSGPGDRFDRTALWIHSCAAAEAGRALADARGTDASTAYVAGLLHDLGSVVLADVLGAEYEATIAEAERTGEGLERVEVRNHGAHHAWAAQVLFERWTLPEELCRAVAFHHDPLEDAGGFAPLVAIASWMASAAGFVGPGGSKPLGAPPAELMDVAGLSKTDFLAASEAFEERRAVIELGAGALDG